MQEVGWRCRMEMQDTECRTWDAAAGLRVQMQIWDGGCGMKLQGAGPGCEKWDAGCGMRGAAAGFGLQDADPGARHGIQMQVEDAKAGCSSTMQEVGRKV